MNKKKAQEKDVKPPVSRRNIIKGIGAISVLGAFGYNFSKSLSPKKAEKKDVLAELGFTNNVSEDIGENNNGNSSETVRMGIIGTGPRGMEILLSLGYRPKKELDELSNKNMGEIEDWVQNDDLNVELVGICDVFDDHAHLALDASQNSRHSYKGGTSLNQAIRYKHYRDLLDNKDIDAVIIATPDHHHAQMTIDAIQAGKHVYCEKALCRTEEEVFQVEEVVKGSDRVFQLGHQYTHSPVFKHAKDLIDQNILGPVTLVETTTNRNTASGAWIRHKNENGTLKPGDVNSIDWNQWLGTSPKIPFSLDRYYGWTKWFDYGNGPWGQLFSHEYDAINGLLGLGTPSSCVASGGVYFWKDGRETPDTFNALFEYPHKDLSLMYSLSLSSSHTRGRVIMGRDATMNVGGSLVVTADPSSDRYKKHIESGNFDLLNPIYELGPDEPDMDAVSSATAKYYADRGLSKTTFNGKNIDLTYLHLKDWLNVIRHGGNTKCNIDLSVKEMITILMATKSFKEKRRVTWDSVNRKII
ncbi:Gfo/Idh/MocA family oxidoreductase [Muricauda sp. ANG21]|uniref:Gfo/Idh/MocA family protein n=1 Tax=Allomuricauda sp. ANG21 TaxID=3042468 RepID=UPI003451C8E7